MLYLVLFSNWRFFNKIAAKKGGDFMYYESFDMSVDDKNRMVLLAKIAREENKNGGDFLYFHYFPEKECVVAFFEDQESFELERVNITKGGRSLKFVIPKEFRNQKPFSLGNELTIHYFPEQGFFRIYSRKSKGS